MFTGPTCPGTPGVAKCPEPLCTSQALPHSSGSLGPRQQVLPCRHRSYGLMRQSSTLLAPQWYPWTPGLCRLRSAPAGQRTPGRPEESHHQSPTDPDVNVSAHPARASPSPTASRAIGSHKVYKLLPPTWLARTLGELAHPLRSILITRTFSLLRDDPPLRHASILSPFVGWPLIGFSLGIMPQVPTFHTKAKTTLMPRVCRTPRGQ